MAAEEPNKIPEQLLKAASEVDIEHLCNSVYPFIQIINPEAEFSEKFTPHFVKTANGWVIHNYGEAISASAPHTKDSDQVSSIPNQIAVAKEITKMIADNKWPSIELVAGTPTMKFLLWAQTEEMGLDWFGYTPDEKDKKRRELLVKNGLLKARKPSEAAIVTAV